MIFVCLATRAESAKSHATQLNRQSTIVAVVARMQSSVADILSQDVGIEWLPNRYVFPTTEELAEAAADFAFASLKRLLSQHQEVRLLAATGASQLLFLKKLTARSGLDWGRIELFHLDEYAGLGETHPASFARYIREQIILPTGISKFHLLDGLKDTAVAVNEISQEIRRAPVQLAFAGIGENGHLAFNDPPADFETQEAYAIVTLDEKCRQQQVGEGWFESLEEVPRTAISISVPQLLKSAEIISVVPDARKAQAVKAALEGPITPRVPASALQQHPKTAIFLNAGSASLLGTR
jgi:glucosamine-6-phosphate deaminase